MKLSDQLKNPRVLNIVLPFLAMLAMIGMNYNRVTANPEYRFQIEGYDPRDILRGHYMIFRYIWPETAQNQCSGVSTCCMHISGDTMNPTVLFQACGKSRDGIHVIDRQPDESLRQYYVPEEHAPELESRLRHRKNLFEVGLVVLPDGQGQLRMMYVDGKPLDEFMRELEVPVVPAVPEAINP